METLLLHTCCGPCGTYSVDHLRRAGFALTAFWYNPNIHPFTEHRLRLESLRRFAQGAELPLIEAEGYDIPLYFRAVAGKESYGERCRECYRLRLGRTAREARARGIPTFSTTLLISPYQEHDLLREVGEEVGLAHGVAFHYEDLRPGFRESRRLARELGLFRQKYCGCLFSEWERFGKVVVKEELARLEGALARLGEARP